MEYNDRDDFIKGTFKYNSLVACVCYRPHPKDDGRLYFHFVHTCRGGGGSSTLYQVLVGGYPISGLGGGYPIPGLGLGGGGGACPFQVWVEEGYPIPGLGVPHLRF